MNDMEVVKRAKALGVRSVAAVAKAGEKDKARKA